MNARGYKEPSVFLYTGGEADFPESISGIPVLDGSLVACDVVYLPIWPEGSYYRTYNEGYEDFPLPENGGRARIIADQR